MRAVRVLSMGLIALLLAATPGLSQSGERGSESGQPTDLNDFFNRLSQGKDILIRSEMPEPQQRIFDRLAERLGVTDGRLTREQFMQAMSQEAGRRSRGEGPGPGRASRSAPSRGRGPGASLDPEALARQAEATFHRLDANGDGVLSKDEMPADLAAEIDRWDTDRNGVIDLKEFTAYYQARAQERITGRLDATLQSLEERLQQLEREKAQILQHIQEARMAREQAADRERDRARLLGRPDSRRRPVDAEQIVERLDRIEKRLSDLERRLGPFKAPQRSKEPLPDVGDGNQRPGPDRKR